MLRRSVTAAARAFPSGKTLDTWDATASSIPPGAQHRLRTLEWVARRENLCLAGPSSTGKSHFLEALGHHAIDEGYKVTWTTLEQLGVLVRRHRVDDSVRKAIDQLLRTDLIVVDDIGLLPAGGDAAEAFHRLYRRGLRDPLHGDLQQHPPRQLRRAHARHPGRRRRRPAAAPRSRHPHRR